MEVLLKKTRPSLTELGSQYGRLLEIFDELSEGIGVAFNTLHMKIRISILNRVFEPKVYRRV